MELSIKNLGPIRDASLELGDITVLFGPPNTGKSYTLRSLYLMVSFLDQIAFKLVFEQKQDEFRDLLISTLHTAGKMAFLASWAIKFLENSERDEFLAGLEKIARLEGIRLKAYTKTEVTLNLRLDQLFNFKEIFSFKKFVPFDQNSQILLNHKDFSDYIAIALGSIQKNAILKNIRFEEKYIENFFKPNISFELKAKDGSLIIRYDFELRYDIEKTINVMSEKKRGVKPNIDDIKKQLIAIGKGSYKVQNRLIFSHRLIRAFVLTQPVHIYFYLASKLAQIAINQIAESTYTLFEQTLDASQAAFFPFGRSVLVGQLEKIFVEDPVRKHKIFQDLYEDDFHFYSYMARLSLGRGAFIKRNLSNDQADLLKLFSLVLQGDLSYNSMEGLLYRKKGSKTWVRIRLASALASEVTGLILPLLTLPPKSFVIIEEPEAQLHYAAQILTALCLVGLANRFNQKILISTHSDLMVLVLACYSLFKIEIGKVTSFVKELLKLQGFKRISKSWYEVLLSFLPHDNQSTKNFQVNFYYYEPQKDQTIVKRLSPEEILKKVPSITESTDALARWIFSL